MRKTPLLASCKFAEALPQVANSQKVSFQQSSFSLCLTYMITPQEQKENELSFFKPRSKVLLTKQPRSMLTTFDCGETSNASVDRSL